jgi:uncharacterized protein (TIGR03067 family)
MRRSWLLSFPPVLTSFILCAAGLKPPIPVGRNDAETLKEERLLSGLWRVDVFEWEGQRDTAKENEANTSDLFDLRWLFTATKAQAVVRVEGSEWKDDYANYKLNPRAQPKTVDMEKFGSTFKGIYRIDRNRLEVCFSVRSPGGRTFLPGKEGRPADFKTKKDSERMLFIFVRDEKAKK